MGCILRLTTYHYKHCVCIHLMMSMYHTGSVNLGILFDSLIYIESWDQSLNGTKLKKARNIRIISETKTLSDPCVRFSMFSIFLAISKMRPSKILVVLLFIHFFSRSTTINFYLSQAAWYLSNWFQVKEWLANLEK